MIHQPSGGAQGQATDIQIQAEEILYMKKQINNIYVKHTGQDLSLIGKKMHISYINYFAKFSKLKCPVNP